MTKAELNLGVEVIKYTFDKLPPQTKIRVVEELGRKAWANRLDNVVRRIRTSIKRAKISAKDIDRICEEVRREYSEKHRGH